jgi:hypothetical protein
MTPSRYGPISDLRLVVSGDLKAVQRACAAPSVPTLIKLVRKGSGQLIFARASRSERMCGRDGETRLGCSAVRYSRTSRPAPAGSRAVAITSFGIVSL